MGGQTVKKQTSNNVTHMHSHPPLFFFSLSLSPLATMCTFFAEGGGAHGRQPRTEGGRGARSEII